MKIGRGPYGWGNNHIRYGDKIVTDACRFRIVNGWRVCTACKRQVERIEDDLR
ncbi:hypothetical protein [Sphingomonas phage Birtae]|nr:hypothetical protein [Sphingomonas phage Birtae]